MAGKNEDCIAILQRIVDAYALVGQSTGETWGYSKARDAMRTAVGEARQFLEEQKASA